MAQPFDYSGAVYHNWTVLHRADPPRRSGGSYWVCRCVCGTIADVRIQHAIHGRSKGCVGCQRNGKSANTFIRWGERTMLQHDWAASLGILRQTLAWRIQAGWTLTDALVTGADPVVLALLVPDRSTDPVLIFSGTEKAGEQ